MKIGFRLLNQVRDVNTFFESNRVELIRGNADTLYFRLEQVLDYCEDDDAPTELRYIPAVGATCIVNFQSIDCVQEILGRVATNPFPTDTSIWSVPILATDVIQYNSMQITLTEGANVRNFNPLSDLVTEDTDTRRYFA